MMLISWNLFSQTATKTVQNKDSVKISRIVATKIAEDLVLLDAVRYENLILKEDTALLQKQLLLKDATIKIREQQIDLYKSTVSDYQSKEHVYQDMLKTSNRKIKWMKFQRTGLGVLLVAAVTFFTIKQ